MKEKCPHCGAEEYHEIEEIDNSGESSLQIVFKCRSCGATFVGKVQCPEKQV